MTKRRNPQAVAAWERHGGAHTPAQKPEPEDDTVDELDEYMARDKIVVEFTMNIDGEEIEFEFDWDDDEGEDDDE